MKLRVGEAANYIGLGNDTLRYYESLGIVKPHRDQESGYRIYDDWALHYLMDAKWYRSFDFPLSDVSEIITSDGLEDILNKCYTQQDKLLHVIEEYQNRSRMLYALIQRINQIKPNVGKFTYTMSPGIVYQRHQLKPDRAYADRLRRWKDLFPNVNHTFLMYRHEVQDLLPESEPYFGFSISASDAVRFQVDPTPPAHYVPPMNCLYTIFKAEGPGTFIENFRTQVLDPVKQMGRHISDSIWGNLIVRFHENGEIQRYFEVYIPTE